MNGLRSKVDRQALLGNPTVSPVALCLQNLRTRTMVSRPAPHGLVVGLRGIVMSDEGSAQQTLLGTCVIQGMGEARGTAGLEIRSRATAPTSN